MGLPRISIKKSMLRIPDFRAMIDQRARTSESLWPRLIEFWLAVILILFFELRILNSHLGRYALDAIRHAL